MLRQVINQIWFISYNDDQLVKWFTYNGEASKVMLAGHFAYGPSKKPHAAKCLS